MTRKPTYEELERKIKELEKESAKRKNSEATLQESGALFRRLFENHAAVKLIIDPLIGDIIDANAAAAEFYGWSREQLRQMKIQDINTLPSEEVKQEMEKARSHERIHFEFRHRLADGSIRDVDVYSSKIQTKGKDLLHSIIHDITERKQAEASLKELISKLLKAIEEIKTLRGILPICANCKKIRDDRGYWEQVEAYVSKHTEVQFSHSICPDCMKKIYPELCEDEKTYPEKERCP